jgi:hypothetical protein
MELDVTTVPTGARQWAHLLVSEIYFIAMPFDVIFTLIRARFYLMVFPSGFELPFFMD